MNNFLRFLNGNNFISVNRDLMKLIGLHETLILSELIYISQPKALNPDFDGWFSVTIEDLEEKTTLGRKPQESAIEKLINLGFIEKVIKGVPGKRFFRINEEEIFSYISKTDFKKLDSKNLSRMSQTDKLECPKRTNWNVPNGQTIYIEETKKETLKERTRTPPTPSSGIVREIPTAESMSKSASMSIQQKENEEMKAILDDITFNEEGDALMDSEKMNIIRSCSKKQLEETINYVFVRLQGYRSCDEIKNSKAFFMSCIRNRLGITEDEKNSLMYAMETARKKGFRRMTFDDSFVIDHDSQKDVPYKERSFSEFKSLFDQIFLSSLDR